MGRQQYLTRLGLGRSAFQEAIEEQHTTVEIAQNGHEAPNPDDHADGGYIQQYDSKGRPVNPATEARNAEMRRAQNSVLALVGVVESREHSQRESEVDLRRAKDERQALLASEDEAGSILEIVLTLVPPVLPWSIDSFIMRYQIGLYDAGQPFAYCLRTFWTPALAGGLQGAYCALLAGGAASTLHAVVRAASDLAVDVIAHPIRGAMLRQGWRRKTLRRLGLVLQCWEVAVLRCVDVLLLPVHYWSMAQQLGLAPAFPLLPPARSLLPWHPSSFHAFGWEPLVNLRFVGVLSSPAALLLFYILAVDFRSNLDLPIASKATEVQYTGANDTDLLVDRQALPRQPLAWLLYQTYYVRAILLRWCGWEL
ncbi:hypothetical protein B0A55_05178 [Friedmanniomyces simplex]|uniref:Uncharacterized protein n=1 Tax=Friedmanniomyces simplex TaxID=329884 RepID=A0A4U0XG33_9PEZI|nr:hypothetical protein B0A55_05178 [Friedmanniomyces simplex]